jgi:hypothetical protein
MENDKHSTICIFVYCPPWVLFHDKYDGSPSCLQRKKNRLGLGTNNNNSKQPLQVAVEETENLISRNRF